MLFVLKGLPTNQLMSRDARMLFGVSDKRLCPNAKFVFACHRRFNILFCFFCRWWRRHELTNQTKARSLTKRQLHFSISPWLLPFSSLCPSSLSSPLIDFVQINVALLSHRLLSPEWQCIMLADVAEPRYFATFNDNIMTDNDKWIVFTPVLCCNSIPYLLWCFQAAISDFCNALIIIIIVYRTFSPNQAPPTRSLQSLERKHYWFLGRQC